MSQPSGSQRRPIWTGPHCARTPAQRRRRCAARPPAPQASAALKRPRLLIVGCGDVGQRVLGVLGGRWRVRALTSQPGTVPALRSLGATPLLGNLDRPATLRRLGALAPRVLHLAPPPGQGGEDPRTAALVRSLAQPGCVQRLVYGSTSGVYGDAGGARFDETRTVAPATDRARRRVDAERRLRAWGRRSPVSISILRIPGIYAADRPGGHPRERLLRGTPALLPQDDVHTNHIHADDLARACVATLLRGRPQRVYHACDDSDLKMGDYFDQVARLSGLPAPRRISWAEACATLPPMQLSFMGESRRLINLRMKTELRMKLRYPSVHEGLARDGDAAA